MAGSFHIIKVRPLTVVLKGGGVPNTVSIHRVTAALGLLYQMENTLKA